MRIINCFFCGDKNFKSIELERKMRMINGFFCDDKNFKSIELEQRMIMTNTDSFYFLFIINIRLKTIKLRMDLNNHF